LKLVLIRGKVSGSVPQLQIHTVLEHLQVQAYHLALSD